jgi:hypothetical protein
MAYYNRDKPDCRLIPDYGNERIHRNRTMTRGIWLTSALALVLLTGPAKAYDIQGVGNSSCGSWTEARRAPNPNAVVSLMNLSWVSGFLSGIGFIHRNGDDPLKGLDREAVIGWIDNYCATHPLENIGVAAGAFYFAHPH